MIKFISCCVVIVYLFFIAPVNYLHASGHMTTKQANDYKQYLSFFEDVYQQFEANYYLKPDRSAYDHFIEKFNNNIYAQLKSEHKSQDYVRWRSAWFLVEALKSKEDKFTQFYPPKPAVKFQQEALGQKIDLGIEGKKINTGFLVTRMEPRSDAYAQGLREDDLVLRINDQDVVGLTQAAIEGQLTPLVNTKVKLTYTTMKDHQARVIEATSKEYFKQTVFLHPVPVEGVFCLEIPKFNRTTGEDLFRFLQLVQLQHARGLVLDLRGNPGGPPLAAREIAAFFLKGGESFTYFQKRGLPKSELDVPLIDPQYQFNGPVVILVDMDSGSASELFAGIMQFRGRAVVMGTNTAGQVLLKTMFPLKDGSMVALVTARGYYPDDHVFSFEGVIPDQVIVDAPKDGLINLAAAYIAMKIRTAQ